MPATAERTFPISLFARAKDPWPKPWPRSIDELVEVLCSPGPDAGEKDQNPMWSPAVWPAGVRRSKAAVEVVTCLVADVDDGTDPAAAVAGLPPCMYVVHTSYSHTPEHPKYRVILPLARAIDAAYFPRAWSWLADRVPCLDRLCVDASRCYFIPVDRPGFWSRVHDGPLLDLDASTLPEPPDKYRDHFTGPGDVAAFLEEIPPHRRDRAVPWFAGVVADRCAKIAALAPEAQDYNAINNATFGLARWSYLAPEVDIAAAVLAAATHRNARKGREDTAEVVAKAIEDGRASPRRPPEELRRFAVMWGHRIDLATSEAIAALAKHPDVFVSGSELVRVLGGSTRPISTAGLGDTLSTVADVGRLVAGAEDGDPPVFKAILPPDDLCKAIRARGYYPDVRELLGVVALPPLRSDGTIATTPGYDPETRLYYAPPEGRSVPPIPERPTQDDARRAAEKLREVVAEFPFEADRDWAAWLACLLSFVGRSLVRGNTPLFVSDANQARVGKTRLAQLAFLIGVGKLPAVVRWNPDPAEVGKAIDSAALAGDPGLVLDNATGSVGGEHLDVVTTADGGYGVRVFNQNTAITVVERPPIVVITGTSMSLHADTAPRALPWRLSWLANNTPNARTFKVPEILRHAQDRQGELWAAAVTILRAWVVAGRPVEGLRGWGSFEAWSSTIRAAVKWATGTDPCDTRERLRSVDSNTSEHDRLVDALEATFGAEPFDSGDITERAGRPENMALWAVLEDMRATERTEGKLVLSASAIANRIRGRIDRPAEGGKRIAIARDADGRARKHPRSRRALWVVA